ncbi:acetyl-CoA carboxylase carboxyl transferase subunit alpha/beta [Desulfobaculum bizertense]|uniref:Acetyl-coenzyme A carboxylase carboxyl transferase subunits beta/alpha n=1 Tax=Desulfobaculum bizertense DSM 18034 TaxID=1121442 RepID=A0A1T4W8E9_9BACT|nr:acetyl-CoA carboxylase carboxyl transferase subunit alpha/beta [Desulfobaculum bizertense]UIJ39194.1 acetyl-CoA carboxylase carboxyl transferase subunit alpha/beta [Desulfobaculum bizertense]SKA73560.1 acetyl-CoA carboxylase carboxyl transferase subunit beta [Desulfobaculum bizertense DSM 18034]
MDTEKRIQGLRDRLQYIQDIFGARENANIKLLQSKLSDFLEREATASASEKSKQLSALEDLFEFLEKKLERELSPMDKVRIVRHSQRICLKDILENVYDNYTELGGQDEYNIDPSMIIARAYITRRVGGKVYNQPVMVIGQEKGHGQEFRNGGSVKPWGNAKALHYMKVAETENIPIHTYVFTPGSYPIEDNPGAAQQIARNLYEMAGLSVPVIACISEGGSGGAEAIALSDRRLMMSHGYYSVISPEGGAAIEGRLRNGQRATPELVESCARKLKITAEDNLEQGYIDQVVQEPALGARPNHFDFFRMLRQDVISATDAVVLNVKGWRFFRAMTLSSRRARKKGKNVEDIYVRWNLSSRAKERLVWRRYLKFRRLAQRAYLDETPFPERVQSTIGSLWWDIYSFFKYDFMRKHQKKISGVMEEISGEIQVVKNRCSAPLNWVRGALGRGGEQESLDAETERSLTELSCWDEDSSEQGTYYVSPQAREDRAVSCPNAATHGCVDMWAPDLFGDFGGVCSTCGHHFRMEYKWYLHNVFDPNSIYEFNKNIESGNPLNFEGLDAKLEKAKANTGKKCACTTFEARIGNVNCVVAMLIGDFRGGSVGAAEGEKFIRAAERARRKHFPFIAYVHGTAGIRIQEGVNGVIQMPRCTMAVRRYIEAGGLYLVLYDTNSYAGPVASFLGCSPYQFAVRSANIGFAGPGVIKETTGLDVPPNYHDAHQALSRGHIQGIWDRREIRKNLQQALMTMGGRNLYYR